MQAAPASSLTLPHASGASIRLLQFTDLHLTATAGQRIMDTDTAASLARVMTHARNRHWPPAALLLTGDLVHDAPAAYPTLAGLLDKMDLPVMCLAGNHDERLALQNACAGPRRQVEGVLRRGSWQLIGLNSAVPGAVYGELGESQLAWLNRQLLATPDIFTLLAVHHHPVPVGSRWLDAIGLRDGAALLTLLAGHPQVRALSWGHIHQAYDARQAHIRLLGTPSTCAQFLPASDDYALDPAAAPGYRWFNLHPDGAFDTGVARLDDKPVP